ncbi:MAG: hypothetical protein OXH99_20080 [Bryobacterales bacterium]|nr:hypothetical protein [Bryobacterales bacterium]
MKDMIRIGTWNTEWAEPGAKIPRDKIISDKLAATKCDILCVTEGFAGILSNGGHVIDAGEDWGCPIKEGRRKVLLWSKQPWTPHTHALGSEEFHKGRFVAGTTETASRARLTVIGVCIPWSGSHVNICQKNLLPWEDHKRWIAGFRKLRCRFPESRTVVLGDFNQRIPKIKKLVPPIVHDALLRSFEDFRFATKGELPGDLSVIDHIAHTPDLALAGDSIKIWPKCVKNDDALRKKYELEKLEPAIMKKWEKGWKKTCPGPTKLYLSDHFGVRGDFEFP